MDAPVSELQSGRKIADDGYWGHTAGTFSFEDVAAAHDYLESGQAVGKVTLRIV